MTVGKYTVGTGGDFANFTAVWSALCLVGSLGKSYEFDQISDVTENAWPDVSVAANRFSLNGNYVKFKCSYNEARKGSHTLFYRIYLSGASGMVSIRPNGALLANDSFYMRYLYFQQITATNVALVTLNPWTSTDTIHFHVDNVYIKGFSTTNATGLTCTMQNCIYKISNLKIWNINAGMNCATSTGGGSAPYDNWVERNLSENVTIWCGSGAGIQCMGSGTSKRKWYFKMCVVYKAGVVGFSSFYGSNNASANTSLYNCADDDGKITVNSAPAVGYYLAYNCLSGITLTTEFESLVDTNNGFLSLNRGSLIAVQSVVPSQGQAPLSVNFGNNVGYSFPNSNLAGGGIAPTLNMEDIAGISYGKYGVYPIGCHNAEVSK